MSLDVLPNIFFPMTLMIANTYSYGYEFVKVIILWSGERGGGPHGGAVG